jgi:hypothetical protein
LPLTKEAPVFEKQRSYPKAVTGSSAAHPAEVEVAIGWFAEQAASVGGQPLVYLPGRTNVDADPRIFQLTRVPGVLTATWLTLGRSQWRGGAVLAAWPDAKHLADISGDPRTKALCVIPWLDKDVETWIRGEQPLRLGHAALDTDPPLLSDPVVHEGLKSLTAMVNLGSNLAGSMDHRDAVAVLQTLHDGGHRFAASDVEAWALANGWSPRGARRLGELATAISSGKRPRLSGPSPLRSDILDIWRAAAEADKPTGIAGG